MKEVNAADAPLNAAEVIDARLALNASQLTSYGQIDRTIAVLKKLRQTIGSKIDERGHDCSATARRPQLSLAINHEEKITGSFQSPVRVVATHTASDA